jgi:ADP-heptose:LPS heptosyltransferase
MGDVLLTGPAIRALAHHARVTLLAGPTGAEAARALAGVDAVLVHALPWIAARPGPCDATVVDGLLADVGALDVDEAVIFTSFHQSPLPLALLLRLAGVRRISAISDDYPGSLLDVRHRVPEDVHEVERALSLAGAAGFAPAPDDDLRLAVRRSGTAPEIPEHSYVVVHPGASVTARAWDPDRYRTLVRSLARRGIPVVVTGGGDERQLTAFVAGSDRRVRDLGGACDLAELAEVVSGAAAIVCGNTGPAHLAAAVGTPVVSLYAPTVPAVRWRPWQVPHVLLGDQDIACRGCRARECPVIGHPCLDVAVADVLHALDVLAPALQWGTAA